MVSNKGQIHDRWDLVVELDLLERFRERRRCLAAMGTTLLECELNFFGPKRWRATFLATSSSRVLPRQPIKTIHSFWPAASATSFFLWASSVICLVDEDRLESKNLSANVIKKYSTSCRYKGESTFPRNHMAEREAWTSLRIVFHKVRG